MFTEGLSNKLVGFFVEDNKEDIVIVKVFGTNTDSMIDRKAEIETMKVCPTNILIASFLLEKSLIYFTG